MIANKITSKIWKRLTKPKSARSVSSYIVGCYKGKDEGELTFTEAGEKINAELNNKLLDAMKISNFKGDVGKTRSFFNLAEKYPIISVSGLGKKDLEYDPNEGLDQVKENIRVATGSGAKLLKDYKVNEIFVDPCGDATAAAEGSALAIHQYDQLKSEKQEKIQLNLLELGSGGLHTSKWDEGMILSDCQNFARDITEMPANYKYPQLFADMICERFANNNKIKVVVRDEVWAEEHKMGSFLSVGKGSINKPRFLEIYYNVLRDKKPIALVGKGVTFDTGGISIKPSTGMAAMRGDMGGAACVIATLDAIAQLEVPVNLAIFVPLVENMPSDRATKPGDVVTAMNGKTIEVDNTDAEGRMILADALCYAQKIEPYALIDLATLTGAIVVALGSTAAGTFTTSNTLWEHLSQASITTGDRLWRMPLYQHYTDEMKWSMTADLKNVNKTSRAAGSPTAAAFLKEFVEIKNWAHLDIAGVNEGGPPAYIGSGMSGRPTRTLIETVRRLASN